MAKLIIELSVNDDYSAGTLEGIFSFLDIPDNSYHLLKLNVSG